MPSTSKHLRRARDHLTVAHKLSGDPETLGWAAVVLFYAARDLVHAVFDADPDLSEVCKHPTSHSNQELANPGTNTVLKRHYRSVATSYLDLYSISLGVRYEGRRVDVEMWHELMQDWDEVRRWASRHFVDWQRAAPDWLAT